MKTNSALGHLNLLARVLEHFKFYQNATQEKKT
jgi:hypothetical protein